MGLRGVCFDVGGTLLASARPGAISIAASALGLRGRVAKGMLCDILHRAPLSRDEAAARLCKLLGRDGEMRQHLALAFAKPSGPPRIKEGVLEALAWCRKHRLKLALLSNCTSFAAIDMRALLGEFDSIVNSWEWGVCKPERAAFAVVERELCLAPEELVHVGDDPIADIAGARAAGWSTILVYAKPTLIQADALIPSLKDLPRALATLRRGLGHGR